MNTTRIPNLMAGLAGLAFFAFQPGDFALARTPAPQETTGGRLSINLEENQKPWTGDLDGMIERASSVC